MARPGDLQVGWQYRAACKGLQSHLFFPPNHIERKQERQRRERAAKAICRECPVLQECREYALMVREPHGIWGGLNEYERRQALARLKKATVPPTSAVCTATSSQPSSPQLSRICLVLWGSRGTVAYSHLVMVEFLSARGLRMAEG